MQQEQGRIKVKYLEKNSWRGTEMMAQKGHIVLEGCEQEVGALGAAAGCEGAAAVRRLCRCVILLLAAPVASGAEEDLTQTGP